jgi:16S rRNA (adenine1518-N6/adenine1519-N6)-dimethyltransferase
MMEYRTLNEDLKQDPRGLLKAFGLRPKKRLGQNFLVSSSGLAKVMQAAQLTGEEQVLEIGAGLGTLSLSLARSAQYLVVVEIDEDLLPALSWVLSGLSNVSLIVGDILALDLAQTGLHPDYTVVANIPYNITSHLIRKLMESPYPARRIVLTIQREVAERIVAGPGDMNMLALSVQIYGQAVVESTLPADFFYPRPEVDSAVIRIDRFYEPAIPPGQLAAFFTIARAGFSQRRKQLQNALASRLGMSKERVNTLLGSAGIRPASRAQELSLADWIRLTDRYHVLDQ